MKNEHGQDMIRLGDSTDHGGEVIEAADDFTVMGRPVALDGHRVRCPKCSGIYPIITTGGLTHRGIRVAYTGDRTGCGATLVKA